MTRPNGRLEPGQPLSGAISARAWNRAQDAADLVLGVQQNVTTALQLTPYLPHTVALAMNSASDCEIGDVLGFDWGTFQAPAFDYEAASVPVLWALPATNRTGRAGNADSICVALEPIEAGSVGRVAVSGIVLAKVDTTNIVNYGYAYSSQQYTNAPTGLGITSNSPGRYLAINSEGVLCPAELGPAVLVSPPCSQLEHSPSSEQPELCLIKIGQWPASNIRFGVFPGNLGWPLDAVQTLSETDRFGNAGSTQQRFRACNRYRELSAGIGNRIVCCALDYQMEWQVIAVTPNPEIDEVVVDVILDSGGKVEGIVKKKLF